MGLETERCVRRVFNILDFHQVADDSFSKCQKVVAELMDQYENQRHSPHRQRLVWKLSNRTLRQLRPTDKFTTRLPTIVEMQGPSHPPIIRPRYVRVLGKTRFFGLFLFLFKREFLVDDISLNFECFHPRNFHCCIRTDGFIAQNLTLIVQEVC